MTLWEGLATAWQTLVANKLRSALTMLGIVIGVSAVVFLVSFGKGHEANITGVFESMGANSIYVTNANRLGGSDGGSLTTDDAAALTDPLRAPAIDLVAPIIEHLATVVYGNKDMFSNVEGATPEAQYVLNYPLVRGIFISDRDVRARANVAVLGNKTADELFGAHDPIGKTVRIGGRNFEVIGILEKKGAFIATMDNMVIIPLSTMQSKILGQTSSRGDSVQTIAIRAVSTDQLDAAARQATTILRQRHNIREGKDNDFNVINFQEIVNRMQEVLGIFQVFLGSVGGISLLVGGIGIMNIMLVSVSERTREIGIRKAVGARRIDVLQQFLIEAAMISLSGGLIGLALAFAGTQLVSGVDLGGYNVQAPMSADIVAIAMAVAIVTGLASGLYPAFRASSLDPIQSLRHE